MDTISVVMPCYNSERYIAEAIGSVVNQTSQAAELIIVDDGSTDRSLEICQQISKKYVGQIKVYTQNNAGPYPARNLGLKYAGGDFIAFLDADDYWHKDFLTLLLHEIKKNKVDIAYCGWQNVGKVDQNRGNPYIPPAYEDTDVVRSFLGNCPWPIHAALMKREIIEKIGGFSERYFTSLDYDLWIRSLSVTQKIARVPEVLAFYRWHDSGQISAVKSRQVIDAWRVRRDFARNNPDLVSHIPKVELEELINKDLLENAYASYWKRDFNTAKKLFFKAFSIGYWKTKDLKYLILCILPALWLKKLTSKIDKLSGE